MGSKWKAGVIRWAVPEVFSILLLGPWGVVTLSWYGVISALALHHSYAGLGFITPSSFYFVQNTCLQMRQFFFSPPKDTVCTVVYEGWGARGHPWATLPSLGLLRPPLSQTANPDGATANVTCRENCCACRNYGSPNHMLETVSLYIFTPCFPKLPL